MSGMLQIPACQRWPTFTAIGARTSRDPDAPFEHPPAYADITTIAGRYVRDTVTAAEGAMRYVDALPTATSSRGMIKVALRATDTAGVDRVASEFAMSPNTASHLVVALTKAIAEHNGAQACNLYAFSGAGRSRRKRKVEDNKADEPGGER